MIRLTPRTAVVGLWGVQDELHAEPLLPIRLVPGIERTEQGPHFFGSPKAVGEGVRLTQSIQLDRINGFDHQPAEARREGLLAGPDARLVPPPDRRPLATGA